MDDDDIDRLLRQLGLDLPPVEDDAAADEVPPSLDDLDENGHETRPRDYRAEWERDSDADYD